MDLNVRAVTDGIKIEGDCGPNFAVNGTPVGLGTPCDGAFVNLSATNITVTANIDGPGTIPVGTVVMFNAEFATIPSNFQLCDGTNGTPDMHKQFVYGTTTEGQLLDSGGDADAVVVEHTHTMGNSGNHNHSFTAQQALANYTGHGDAPDQRSNAQNSTTGNGGNHQHTIDDTGEDPTDKNLPPYIKLAFIQRMS